MTAAGNDNDDWDAMDWDQPRNWTETRDMRYQEWLEVSHPGAAPPRPKPVSTPAPAPARAQAPKQVQAFTERPGQAATRQALPNPAVSICVPVSVYHGLTTLGLHSLDSSPQHQPRPCRININLTSSARSSSISRARRSSTRTLPPTRRIGENFGTLGESAEAC